MKIINSQIQEAQAPPSTGNMKKSTPRHITVKLFKTNDKEKFKKKPEKNNKRKSQTE